MEQYSGLLINNLQFINDNKGTLVATLYATESIVEDIAHLTNLHCVISEIEQNTMTHGTNMTHSVTWYGSNAVELAHQIYELFPTIPNICRVAFINTHQQTPTFNYVLSRDGAVPPTKAHVSDTGYDLTIIEKVKTVGDVDMFTTGVAVQPCHGYYFDVVPRSSISKTGYMMANSVGIIDQSYTGEIIIALRKVDKNADDIQLPCRIAQLIPRTWCHMLPQRVETLNYTDRATGGFGSTN